MTSSAVELPLLFACARVVTTPTSDAAIRKMLEVGLDWTLFARYAVSHEVAALVGHTLSRVAPDLVPVEIRDAFHSIRDQARKRNQALFHELARTIEALETLGVEALPFKGPILALQAFGDFGLR